MMKKNGFTLIELLVVIAIIGVLAAIVLVSLSGARDRAKDARIIADMGQLRTVAEVHLGNTGDYTNLCTNDDVITLQNDICNQKGQTAGCGSPHYSCRTSANEYCVEVQLNSGKWWCVDSALRSKQYDSDPTCAADNFSCE